MDAGILTEIAGRLARAENRIERLETLEFGSVAGGSIFLIERIEVTGAPLHLITFDNIPAIAHQLWVIYWAVYEPGAYTWPLWMRLNNDAGAGNHVWYRSDHYWNNVQANSQGFGTEANVGSTGTSQAGGGPGTGHILIPCYCDVITDPGNKHRSWVWDEFFQCYLAGEPPLMEFFRSMGGGSWKGTDAINRLDFFPSGAANFGIGTCFSLYGIG